MAGQPNGSPRGQSVQSSLASRLNTGTFLGSYSLGGVPSNIEQKPPMHSTPPQALKGASLLERTNSSGGTGDGGSLLARMGGERAAEDRAEVNASPAQGGSGKGVNLLQRLKKPAQPVTTTASTGTQPQSPMPNRTSQAIRSSSHLTPPSRPTAPAQQRFFHTDGAQNASNAASGIALADRIEASSASASASSAPRSSAESGLAQPQVQKVSSIQRLPPGHVAAQIASVPSAQAAQAATPPRRGAASSSEAGTPPLPDSLPPTRPQAAGTARNLLSTSRGASSPVAVPPAVAAATRPAASTTRLPAATAASTSSKQSALDRSRPPTESGTPPSPTRSTHVAESGTPPSPPPPPLPPLAALPLSPATPTTPARTSHNSATTSPSTALRTLKSEATSPSGRSRPLPPPRPSPYKPPAPVAQPVDANSILAELQRQVDEERALAQAAEREAQRKRQQREEEMRRAKAEAEAVELKRKEDEAREAERAAAEQKERARLEAEQKERARLEAEQKERARLDAEEKERRAEAEAQKRARLQAEEEERAKREAEPKERTRLQAEDAARLQREARAEAERAEKEQLSSERKEKERQAKEQARKREEAEKRARLDAELEAQEKARREAKRREEEREEKLRREEERAARDAKAKAELDAELEAQERQRKEETRKEEERKATIAALAAQQAERDRRALLQREEEAKKAERERQELARLAAEATKKKEEEERRRKAAAEEAERAAQQKAEAEAEAKRRAARGEEERQAEETMWRKEIPSLSDATTYNWTVGPGPSAMSSLLNDREQIFAKQRTVGTLEVQRASRKAIIKQMATYAHSTGGRAVYAYKVRDYESFCRSVDVPPWPLSTVMLALFCIATVPSGCALGTANNIVAGLRNSTRECSDDWQSLPGFSELSSWPNAERALLEWKNLQNPMPDEEERAVETPGGMSPDASEAAFEPDRGDEVEDEDENEDDEDAAEEEDEDGEDVDEAAEDDTIAKPGKSGKRVRRTADEMKKFVDECAKKWPLPVMSGMPRPGQFFADLQAVLKAVAAALVPNVGVTPIISANTIACSRSNTGCPFRVSTVRRKDGKLFIKANSVFAHNHGPDERLVADPTWRPTMRNDAVAAAVAKHDKLAASKKGKKRISDSSELPVAKHARRGSSAAKPDAAKAVPNRQEQTAEHGGRKSAKRASPQPALSTPDGPTLAAKSNAPPSDETAVQVPGVDHDLANAAGTAGAMSSSVVKADSPPAGSSTALVKADSSTPAPQLPSRPSIPFSDSPAAACSYRPSLEAFLFALHPSLAPLTDPLIAGGITSARTLALFAGMDRASRHALYEDLRIEGEMPMLDAAALDALDDACSRAQASRWSTQ